MFLDRVCIEVSGGRGGNGCLSFRREKYIPKGGPDGGNGGNGGSVIIRAENDVNSLVALSSKKKWAAGKGENGKGSNKHGKCAEDIVLLVPPGTFIIDEEHGFVIKDLQHVGDEIVVARGGRGGKGNAWFKSSTNQAPRQFSEGEPGEQRRIILELKVIADVGLIGKPNAGKSTLLSRLTKATPEIADYPFTTKYPNLGMVRVDFERSFVIADIPGLIEGAAEGVGLGHDFLKHIERSGVLVHLVEPHPMDGTDPIANYHSIRKELVEFNPALQERQEIVVISKSELPDSDLLRQTLEQEIGRPVLAISAQTGQGLSELIHQLVQALESRFATQG